MPPLPNQRIGSYVLLERLGAGALGEVWKARDRRLERIVALKFLMNPEKAKSARELVREARAASGLNHPNIVTVFDIGESEGSEYLAMEFVEGETLRARMNRGPISLREAREIGFQIANGLAEAHRHGIIHRDLKPENIMLRVDGVVKLVDFGLAKRQAWTDSTASTAGDWTAESAQIAGTFGYMSPEQARGQPVTAASDVFSFGIILYEVITGSHPFKAETILDTLNAILSKEYADIRSKTPDVSADLVAAVARSLKKMPAERFENAAGLVEALASDRTIPVVDGAAARVSMPHSALLVALLIAVFVLCGWVLYRYLSPSQSVRSLAVLTLQTDPQDGTTANMSEELAEDLGSALSRAGLTVASRGLVIELVRATDLRTAGSQLGIDALLQGTLRLSGGRYRLYVELVNTRNGFQIWSGTFMVPEADLAGATNEIAADVVTQVRQALEREQ